MKTLPLQEHSKAPRRNGSAEGYWAAMQGGQAVTSISGDQSNA